MKVMEKLGIDHITIATNSSEPYEEQFWKQFDFIMGLTEEGLANEYPLFVTNPNDHAKLEAVIAQKNAQLESGDNAKIASGL